MITIKQKEWLDKFYLGTGFTPRRDFENFSVEAQELLKLYEQFIQLHNTKYRELLASITIETPHTNVDEVKPVEVKPAYALTDEQKTALGMLINWLKQPSYKFVLFGFAGTGKTFLLKEFAKVLDPNTTLYTAPTNKATRVLRSVLPNGQCRTIYSALSLKMVEREDERVLEASDHKFDLSGYATIVVDEGSMLHSELMGHIDAVESKFGIKFLFLCDEAQLPPVGENVSPVTTLFAPNFRLTKVVRHDNQILEVATHVRNCIMNKKRLTPVDLDVSTERSVWRLSHPKFVERIQQAAKQGFQDMRVIAWRNATVDRYNALVRASLFDEEVLSSGTWTVGDLIVLTQPVKIDSKIVATTDDEGIVKSVSVSIEPETGLECYFLSVKLEDGGSLRLRVLHENSFQVFQATKNELAANARKPGKGKEWGKFWWLNDRFHNIRHAYAITAHRSQGSTFKYVFVDSGDILANVDRDTAYRCLYVAATRPSDRLYLSGFPT